MKLCPVCGSPDCVNDEFCSYTGKPIRSAPPPPAPPPPAPPKIAPPPLASAPPASPPLVVPKKSRTGKFVLALVLVAALAFLGLGLFTVGSRFLYSKPTQQPPKIPQRVAGVMSVFPVDTNKSNPSRPASVTRETLTAGKTPKVPQASLPRGIQAASLPRNSKSITSASYTSPGVDKPVSVHVLEPRDPNNTHVREMADEVATQTGGTLSGAQVQSPSGQTYTGFRVLTSQDETYVLERQSDPVVVLVYAPAPELRETADRLVTDLGNGSGITDDPDARDSFSALPAELPPGMELADFQVYPQAAMLASTDQFTRAIGSAGVQSPELNNYIQKARSLIPKRLTTARFTDPTRGDHAVLVGDYGSLGAAWSMWSMLRLTTGLTGMHSVSVHGVSGLALDNGGKSYMIFQRGPYVGGVMGPAGSNAVKILAENLQF